MNQTPSPSRIIQAVDALKRADRTHAVFLLNEEVRIGPPTGDRWKSVALLASRVCEIDIAIEAARRYSMTSPITLDRQLHYWAELANVGRADQAIAAVRRLPAAQRNDPNVLHFSGTLAGERGDFQQAEQYFRRALARSPTAAQSWFALAMIKTFSANDADIAAMERLRSTVRAMIPVVQARFLYGLAKAYDDIGHADQAFALYAEGAALRRAESPFDANALSRFADGLIRQFTPENMRMLVPSTANDNRVIFVNGLPRSGTTLVEQILASHSAVCDGGELNLLRAALLPTTDYSFVGSIDYQQRFGEANDPWGDVGRQYSRLIAMRFSGSGQIIDKTLGQSHLMGLLLHTLPTARVIWMRRDPADTALSCFRSFFTSPITWSWSLADIARFFRIEDRLYQHWTTHFPERILTVPYEDIARFPTEWIPKILAHAGLSPEPQVFDPHKTARSVRTASVQQVRSPISSAQIGKSQRYDRHLDVFRAVYYA